MRRRTPSQTLSAYPPVTQQVALVRRSPTRHRPDLRPASTTRHPSTAVCRPSFRRRTFGRPRVRPGTFAASYLTGVIDLIFGAGFGAPGFAVVSISAPFVPNLLTQNARSFVAIAARNESINETFIPST